MIVSTMGIFVAHRGRHYKVAFPDEWEAMSDRDDLFDQVCRCMDRTNPAHVNGYDLDSHAMIPLQGHEVFIPAGVTFPGSVQKRRHEFFRGLIEQTLGTLDSPAADALLKQLMQIRTPYETVGDPRNPGEIFFGGGIAQASTHGGFAGFRGSFLAGGKHRFPGDVPEPEPGIHTTSRGVVNWFTVGLDMTGRELEALSFLLLMTGKVFKWSKVICHQIIVPNPKHPVSNMQIRMRILRGGAVEFDGTTSTKKMLRSVQGIAQQIWECGPFPYGVVSLLGTNLVPPKDWTLRDGDKIEISSKTYGLSMTVTAKKVKYAKRKDPGAQFAWGPDSPKAAK